MSRPKMLDLYCRVGGAGKGYQDAGFDIYGVDIEHISEYPGAFHCGDALAVMRALLAGKAVPFIHRDGHTEWLRLQDIAAVHASPPCQASSALTKGTNQGREYLNLIPATRDLLPLFNVPTVLENVQGSDLRRDLTLCGEMFDLAVIRHRYFELGNWKATPPYHKKHRGKVQGWRHGEYFDGPYFAVYGDGGGKGTVEQWQDAMGIHWTSDRKNLAEAIPPAYTKFIGAQLLDHIELELAA
jgi:DNA (cytosine-5)-methyltransferase 1